MPEGIECCMEWNRMRVLVVALFVCGGGSIQCLFPAGNEVAQLGMSQVQVKISIIIAIKTSMGGGN